MPGVIAMSIVDDPHNRIDMNYDRIVVLWNASPEETTFSAAGLGELTLHPLLTDAHNSQATYDGSTFTLPPRSTAVFVHENIVAQPTVAPAAEKAEAPASNNMSYWLVGLVALIAAVAAYFGLRKKK